MTQPLITPPPQANADTPKPPETAAVNVPEKVIVPSIGRIVWYWHSAEQRSAEGAQPQPAQVCYVHNERMVNVAGFNANGAPFSETSVRLVQPEDQIPLKGSFVEWMPYQITAAAR